jgi:hypothetical protein
LEENGTRIATPEERTFETEDQVIESGLRRTIEARDMVMRSLVRAVYRFGDATLVAEKKDDFGNALQNLYRELERAEIWLDRTDLTRTRPIRCVSLWSPNKDSWYDDTGCNLTILPNL